ncbi:MAG TPA: hypothetical protein VF043_23320 [Ktedonobacteraceae bacterium]
MAHLQCSFTAAEHQVIEVMVLYSIPHQMAMQHWMWWIESGKL